MKAYPNLGFIHEYGSSFNLVTNKDIKTVINSRKNSAKREIFLAVFN